MNPEQLAAIKDRSADVRAMRARTESDLLDIACHYAVDIPALVAEVERLRGIEAGLRSERPEWIVNDNAELGVMVHGRAFFLYKGRSLEYEEAKHDDGSRMMYRPVGKREFGECCHPVGMNSTPDRYTVPLVYQPGLSFGNPLPNGGWMPLPVNDAALRAAGSGE